MRHIYISIQKAKMKVKKGLLKTKFILQQHGNTDGLDTKIR